MADNMTPEDLAREAAAYAEAVKNGTANTKEWNDRIANMSLQARRSAEDLKNSLGALGKSAAGLAGQLAQGARGASIYNDAIGAGADVAGKALKMLFPKAQLLGSALSMAANAAGAYFKAANKQADALFKSYNEFNKVGAATSGGMQDIIGNLHQFGYTMAELDKMIAIVAANSTTLSKFGGTVGLGTKRFAALSNEIIKSDLGRQLMLAGQMPDDINKGVAMLLKQQTMLGMARQRSDDELIRRAFDLSKEFDILRRITGDTIEQQEKKQEELLMSDVGGAIVADLEEKNLTAQAQALQGFQKVLPEAFSQKLLSVAGGNVGMAPEMLQIFPQLIKELQLVARGQSQATTDDLRRLYIEEARVAERRFRQQGRLGVLRDILGAEVLSTLRKEGAQDKNALTTATADFEAGVESNTGRMVDMTRAQISTTQAMEKLVNYGVTPATVAMKAFAELTAKVAGITLPTPTGGAYTRGGAPGGAPGAAPAAGAATAGRMVLGGAEARTKAEEYLGRKMSDAEYSALIKAVHAEASGGRQGNQQEQAGIMASILNRARTHPGSVVGALQEKNQFQAVTGTAYQPGPSREFLRGPSEERLKNIEGAVSLLPQISREQKNFTAANAAAYGPGTNIGYRNQMLAKGGTVVGGTVFNTPIPNVATPTGGFNTKLTDMDGREKLGNATARQQANNNPPPASFSEDLERRKMIIEEEKLSLMRRQLAAQEKTARSL